MATRVYEETLKLNKTFKPKLRQSTQRVQTPPSRHREFQSRDHSIRNVTFPIGCPLESSLYLCEIPNVLVSRDL